jgi:antitoxin (DNA-binding transcriptional repressor) of toxin-antitoxin stability system
MRALWGTERGVTLSPMSELPLGNLPEVADVAHEAARGQVFYITEHGERVAAIVPAEVAAVVEQLSAGELAVAAALLDDDQCPTLSS